MTADLSIAALLQAAEYLERRDAEHGFVFTVPISMASDTRQHSAALAAKYNNHKLSPDDPFHYQHNYTRTSDDQQHKLKPLDSSQIIKFDQPTNRTHRPSAPIMIRQADNRKQAKAEQNHYSLSSRVSVSSWSSCSNQSGTDLQTTSASSSGGGSCPIGDGYLEFSTNPKMNFNGECNSSAINLNHHQSHLLLVSNHPDYNHLPMQHRPRQQSITDQVGSMSLNSGVSGSPMSCSGKGAKKPQGNRSLHKELEKNRRANLRTCLERLKEVVPLETESSRHTTFSLLTRARDFIKTLEERDQKQQMQIADLLGHQRSLRNELEQTGGCSNLANTGAAASGS